MCGRFAITLPPDAVRAYFAYSEQPNFPLRANIAPTQPVPIVLAERNGAGDVSRHFRLMRWGFLPSFIKDPKDYPLVINARSDSAAEKASFKNALRRRRCLFLADGFYEWQRATDAPSRPFLIRRQDRLPLGMAGLWETWIGLNGEEVETACVLTTSSNGVMSAVHDRMPVLLEQQQFDLWLSPDERDAEAAAHMMRPAAEDVLELVEIGPAVNKVANDGLWIQEPIDPSKPRDVITPTPKKEKKAKAAPETGQGELF
jgi:putative SOS response-associated peptidase YedK